MLIDDYFFNLFINFLTQQKKRSKTTLKYFDFIIINQILKNDKNTSVSSLTGG